MTQPDAGRALTDLFAEKSANDIYNSFGLPKTQHERFIQLQQEMVGNTARVARVSAGRDAARTDAARRTEQGRDWLQRMSAEYQRSYYDLMDTIGESRQELDRMDERLRVQEEEMRRQIGDMEARTITLPDGRRVFVNEYGNFVDETGQRLKKEDEDWVRQQDAERIQNLQKYENYRNLQDHLQRIEQQRERIQRYRQDLARLEEQAKNGELTQQELQDAKQKLKDDLSAQGAEVGQIEQATQNFAAQSQLAVLGEQERNGVISREARQQASEKIISEMPTEEVQEMTFAKSAFGDLTEDDEQPVRTVSHSGSAIEGPSLRPEFSAAQKPDVARTEPIQTAEIQRRITSDGPTPT